MEVVTQQSGVQSFPASSFVAHAHEVRDQNVVVDLRVAAARGRMAGNGPGQPFRGGADLGAAAPPAVVPDSLVEVGHGGVPFGVDDPVHVLGPVDDA
jgi:hypothetical protein